MSAPATERTVFIISDGTGITAETFSHSVLSQFESVTFKQVRVPFIDARPIKVTRPLFSPHWLIQMFWRVYGLRMPYFWTCSAPLSSPLNKTLA